LDEFDIAEPVDLAAAERQFAAFDDHLIAPGGGRLGRFRPN
jgi:hypothetical protein